MSPIRKGTKVEREKGELTRPAGGRSKPRSAKLATGPGRPMASRSRVAVTLLLPPELRRQLRILGATEDREMSDIVEDALLAYFKTRGLA
jgi:hypothetical protein